MKIPPVPDHPVRWSTTDAVLVVLGAQLVSLLWAGGVTAGVFGGQLPDPLTPRALVALNVGLWAGYGLGPVLVARLKGAGARADYGLTVGRFDVPAGLALGAVMQLAVLPVLYRVVGWFVSGDPGASAKALVDAAHGPLAAVLLVFATLVMAPLVEELCFRGLFLRALQRRLGPVVAVLVSAAVFALLHLDALAFPGLFLFAVVSALLALRWGRLGPSVAFHVGFNAATLVVLGLR